MLKALPAIGESMRYGYYRVKTLIEFSQAVMHESLDAHVSRKGVPLAIERKKPCVYSTANIH
jgi:hypothetical protein